MKQEDDDSTNLKKTGQAKVDEDIGSINMSNVVWKLS